MSRNQRIAIAIYFYIAWFGCIFMARENLDLWTIVWPGILLLAVVARFSFKELITVTAVVAIGLAWDFGLFTSGMIQVPGREAFPVWLISIWILFAISTVAWSPLLNFNLKIAALLGLVFGPLSYISGEAFEVLRLTSPLTVGLYAGFWAVFFPAILTVSRKV